MTKIVIRKLIIINLAEKKAESAKKVFEEFKVFIISKLSLK